MTLMNYYQLQQKILVDENISSIQADTPFCGGYLCAFEDIEKISEGATCYVYHGKKKHGSKVIIKEFCPTEFRRYAYRDVDGALQMNFPKGIFTSYMKENYERQKLDFINEWFSQKYLQDKNIFTGTNSPELFADKKTGTPYIVMNYEGNAVFFHEMKDMQRYCEEQNLDYITMILRVLRAYGTDILALHKTGHLLLDIKPDNILMTRSENEFLYRRIIDYGSNKKLTDFQRISDGEQNLPIRLSYTAEYAAPELVERKFSKVSFASDIYSFGLTVLSYLTGRVIEANEIHLLHLTDESFRENLIQMAQETGFVAITKKGEQFFHLLNIFISLTLSEEIMDTEDAFTIHEVGMRHAKQQTKRCTKMEDVLYLLTVLIGNNEFQFEEILIQNVLNRLRKRADDYIKFVYGAESEKKFNSQLFSANLMPTFEYDKKKHFYIEGESGTGKTTFMKYQYANLVTCNHTKTCFPVWIQAAELADQEENGQEAYPDYVKRAICKELFGESVSQKQEQVHKKQLDDWIFQKETPIQINLFVDGINEISWHPAFKRIKTEIQNLMKSSNLYIMISGQNQKFEFPEYTGDVKRLEHLDSERIRTYMDEKMPEWKKNSQIRKMIEDLFPVMNTPCLLHYFCLPFIGLNEIPLTSIPKDKVEIMDNYLCKMEYCVQDKIHGYVAEYPQQTRPEFGPILLNHTLGAVCLEMAIHRSMFVTKKNMEQSVISGFEYSPEGNPMLGQMPVRQPSYEKIISLGWCSYLFAYRNSKYYIIHESHRDYIAAKYLCYKIRNHKNLISEEIWSSIPQGVIEYLAIMLDRKDIILLRKIFLKKRGSFLKRYVKSAFVEKQEMVSEFFEKDERKVGENLYQIIQHSPWFKTWEKMVCCLSIPKENIVEPGRKKHEIHDMIERAEDEKEQPKEEIIGITKDAIEFLKEAEGCNQKGIVYQKLTHVLTEEFLRQISLVAGYNLLSEDIYFRGDILLENMISKKKVFYDVYETWRENIYGGAELTWSMEDYFKAGKPLKGRDLSEVKRQEGIFILLKQFVIMEYYVYHECGGKATEEMMIGFSQLYLMLWYSVCEEKMGNMNTREHPLFFEERIHTTSYDFYKGRPDLLQACILLKCCEKLTFKDFVWLIHYRIKNFSFIDKNTLKKRDMILGILLLTVGLYRCIQDIRFVPILLLFFVLVWSLKFFLTNIALLFEVLYIFIKWVIASAVDFFCL